MLVLLPNRPRTILRKTDSCLPVIIGPIPVRKRRKCLRQKVTNRFYISHYGRHGSRYLIGTKDYDTTYFTLAKADSLGKLTPLGKATMGKLKLIREEAMLRDGELTQRGAEQHKGIARRMYQNFPEVFAGRTTIDAKSTTVIRCILPWKCIATAAVA